MRRHLGVVLRAGTLAVGLAGWGCGAPAHDAGVSGREAARTAEWRWLQATKTELDAERDRLAQAGADGLAAADLATGTAGQTPPPANATAAPGRGAGARAPTPQDAHRRQIEIRTDELNRRLVEFLNADPPAVGEPLSPGQRQAIRMKSDEDIRVARGYVEEAGDYRRAFEILRSALIVDPENPRLKEELERTRSRRYMTAARFAQVAEGMTAGEVREVLGAPNPKDVRAYPDKGVVGWFYPKDPAGAAAAVWFARGADGAHAVYELDFAAVPAPGAGGAPETREAPAARSAA